MDGQSPPALLVIGGGGTHVLDPSSGPAVIGRGTAATVVVADPHVSRAHVRLEPRQNHWVAVDISQNGMFLDGQRRASVTVEDRMTLRLNGPDGVPVVFQYALAAQNATQSFAQLPIIVDEDDPTTRYRPDPNIARAGGAVGQRRTQLGLALGQLAHTAAIDPVALNAFESGRSWPSPDTLTNLEEALQWPPGTLDSIRRGVDSSDREAAVEQADATDEILLPEDPSFIAETLTLAMGRIDTAIDVLPSSTEPDYAATTAAILSDLRELADVASAAVPAAGRGTELVAVLGRIRGVYNELMIRVARTPTATLGQRLYAVRVRHHLTVDETATAAGVSPEALAAVESDEPQDEQTVQAMEALIAALNDR